MTRDRTTRAVAIATGALALGAWGLALAPAHAQLTVPELPSPPPVEIPPPVRETIEPVAPVLDDAIDTVNDTIDTAERTVNETLGRLPELPVDLPTVDLPEVPDPLVDPPVTPPPGTTPTPTPAPNRPGESPTGSSAHDGRVTSVPGPEGPVLADDAGSAGEPGSSAGQSRRGDGGQRLASRAIANRGTAPEEFLDAVADEGLPRGLVLAAAALLTLVSLALAWTAHTDARGALALVERLQAPVPLRA